jgi:hypothetical protein
MILLIESFDMPGKTEETIHAAFVKTAGEMSPAL